MIDYVWIVGESFVSLVSQAFLIFRMRKKIENSFIFRNKARKLLQKNARDI